ncbi:MAG: hypothetical protein QOH57_4349 [Mycobacterium sp.]|jgi:hypothetical protein|nr:hypothetical protein [Mycobacterium sp.]
MDQPTQHIPRSVPGEQTTQQIPTSGMPPNFGPPPGPQGPPGQVAEKPKVKRPIWRDPLSLTLIVVIVVALVAAGLAITEIFARNRADTKVAAAINCVTKDENGSPDISFAVLPPFLWQHMTGDYRDIRIVTEGNIRGAEEMKIDLSIGDVRLDGGTNGAGRIGPLDATVTWPAEGIKKTIQKAPLVGSFVSDVKTNATDGTIVLTGAAGNVVTKPQVAVDSATNAKKLTLQVQSIDALGFSIPSETVQGMLNELTDQLANSYPLNVKPDSVQVTNSGVEARFTSSGADLPKDNQDPCFANL